MTQTILFQGKYDLNIAIMRQVLNVDAADGSRHQDERYHEIVEMALWDNLVVMVQDERNVTQDIWAPSSRCMDTIHDVLIIAKHENGGITYISADATSTAGEAFLQKYLPKCLIREQCQKCGRYLIGDEALRNHCICPDCE